MPSPTTAVALSYLLAAPAVVQAGCTVGKLTCYVDSTDRVLSATAIDSDHVTAMTQKWCAQLCADMQMPLAGVEDGGECYCGNELKNGAKVAPDAECNTPCKNSEKEPGLCGGDWRVGVFNVSCSGQPEPAPEGSAFLVNPCLQKDKPYSKQPWCDHTLPIDKRVDDMISRMTVAEKIGSLVSTASPIKSLGLPAFNWWSEATHGISHVRNVGTTRHETNFAFPITTAMSFNRSLWYTTGQRIAVEARAFMNAGNAYSTYWAPVVNLAREPRWGRNLECPGEDPYLSGEYAAAFIHGFERNPKDTEHIQASACCKHYIANEMEGSTVAGVHWDRNHFDATVSMRDLKDSYLPPFQACVEKGNVSSLMCSYNAVNGVPSCANDWLLQTMARDTWKFDGYIAGDCGADSDVFNSHHYTKTPEETVQAVFRAGTDIDCGDFVSQNAQSALDKGLITEKDLDDRLRKAFRVRMRLSNFDPKGPLDEIPTSEACSAESQAVAREGTIQGTTLLKNAGAAALPLDASRLKSVAVLGPNANLSKDMAGYYGGNSCGDKYPTTIDAVRQYVNITRTVAWPRPAKGSMIAAAALAAHLEAAAGAASEADATVLVLGCDLHCAQETTDATTISLPSDQEQLVKTVAQAAKGPVVVVMLTHIPLDISSILANDKVGAVLHAGQPAVQTLGLGDVLFGRRVPAGRTIQTVYPAAYADQISIFDFNMRPGPSAWPRPDCPAPFKNCKNGTNPGRTHRFYTGKAVVPFGFGLSYTSFSYKVVSMPATVNLDILGNQLFESPHGHVAPGQPAVQYVVEVTNTGKVDADDVVLGFLAPPGAGQDGVPLQSLFGFERVHLKAGQSKKVTLSPELVEFSQVDASGVRRVWPGDYKVRFGVPGPGAGFAETTLKAVVPTIVV